MLALKEKNMNQRLFRLVAAVSLLAPIGIIASAVTVSGQANIFSAGHAFQPDPGGGGGGLPAVEISAAGIAYFEFTSVTGLTNCCSSTPNTGPDGEGSGTNISSTDGISGIKALKHMFLVGVYLDATEPTGAGPAILDFASIGTSFTDLSPVLNQTFWIGDGLTGTGSGSLQKFHAPTGATRLFLGIADANGFWGAPGYYDDNRGAYEVEYNAVVPEPGTMAALLLGVAGIARRRARR